MRDTENRNTVKCKTALWCPLVRRLPLEPIKSRLGPSKFTFNAENFIRSFFVSISIDFSAIRFWNVSRSPKSPKNSLKTLFWGSVSPKVIEFGGNRKPVYDFLLVINSYGLISHCYWDRPTATYCLKSQIFVTPLSFIVLVRSDPPLNLWKSFRSTVSETKVF